MIAIIQRLNFSTISPIPGILANFCAVNTKKKIKIKKTNRVSNKLVTLNVTKYGTNKPILSAPQLAIVTIATVPTNLDNPFSFNSFLALFSPSQSHK